MKFLLGQKGRMSQIFTEDGRSIQVTELAVEPMVVVQVKRPETDGYSAVQVGYGRKKESRSTKAERGHTGDLGSFRYLREFRVPEAELDSWKKGDEVKPEVISDGDVVSITAITKGKGIQGVVKRHNFAGGPRSHGQKHGERSPGSIGSMGIKRVMKGKKMAGRMGGGQVTRKKAQVVYNQPEEGRVMIKGAIPGVRGGLVKIIG